MLLFLAWLVHDYAEAAENMERLRFENARIGTSRHSEAPSIALLTQLREYLAVTRVDIHRSVDADTLDGLRKVAERYASDSSLYRYAMAAVVSGRPDLAASTLQRLCWLHAKDDCRNIRLAWSQEAQARHPEMRAVLETVESRHAALPAR